LIARGFLVGFGLGLHCDEVGSHVGPQRTHFGSESANVGLQLGLELRKLGLRRHFGANAAKQFENEVFGFAGHGEPYNPLLETRKDGRRNVRRINLARKRGSLRKPLLLEASKP
jgi:hypothetical protein